ncbi:hypothetical protein EBAPG3_002205 [Nitrosospira lacus]|uniref:Uncharacterized protein n=1 Tax=Nitrosospira lacus TaxID=1288494 RepID=A0A1W6SLK0_9PROT|nr:hypothetical protein EBAPG3_002205 [Nitrosospira lacus]
MLSLSQFVTAHKAVFIPCFAGRWKIAWLPCYLKTVWNDLSGMLMLSVVLARFKDEVESFTAH